MSGFRAGHQAVENAFVADYLRTILHIVTKLVDTLLVRIILARLYMTYPQ